MTRILPPHSLPSLALASGALIMLALLTGCRESNIQVYQVPKEVPPPTTARAPGAPAEMPHLHWKTPAGWEEGEASGEAVPFDMDEWLAEQDRLDNAA